MLWKLSDCWYVVETSVKDCWCDVYRVAFTVLNATINRNCCLNYFSEEERSLRVARSLTPMPIPLLHQQSDSFHNIELIGCRSATATEIDLQRWQFRAHQQRIINRPVVLIDCDYRLLILVLPLPYFWHNFQQDPSDSQQLERLDHISNWQRKTKKRINIRRRSRVGYTAVESEGLLK
jgi:hypothetical protein